MDADDRHSSSDSPSNSQPRGGENVHREEEKLDTEKSTKLRCYSDHLCIWSYSIFRRFHKQDRCVQSCKGCPPARRLCMVPGCHIACMRMTGFNYLDTGKFKRKHMIEMHYASLYSNDIRHILRKCRRPEVHSLKTGN